ncbi:MAG: hypothetical protein PHH37_12420 [Paludibacter sp.]|nr:hypothetical protein [Paludibacter sp.]
MKKLSLLFIATAMVAFTSFFSSCTDNEPTTVTITLDASTFESGAAVTGTIKATGELSSVTLLKNGPTVDGWPITDFSAGSSIVGSDSTYTIRISGLADGTYTLRATDKNSVEDNKTFTVETTITMTALENATKIYCTLADGSSNSTCASANGTTYAANSATAEEQTNIDFVYFNNHGTSLGIYAPSAVPTEIATTFANWTTKNTTLFAKTTAISYSTATYTEVKAAADAATATSVEGLATNDVVVFKTAAGKVGVFKVNSITSGFLATDYVEINIKVQP